VLALAAILLTITGWQVAIRWHPSDADYPLQGIDVSHHQGAIDWRLLPDQGVDFAYIKASEGADVRDPAFAANWASARREGIARGAYHYFTLCRSGAEQAANFIAAVPADPAMLRPAVDLEFGGNCADRPPPEKLIRELTVFIRLVEAHYGKRVTLYLTREFDAGYEVSKRIPRKLWLRNLVLEPDWGARRWSLWQASSFRSLAGIDGRVDWNVGRP
jgi:lysozyme